jgi:hypothetical protein
MQALYVSSSGPLKWSESRECGLFKRSRRYETIHMEEIPSLLNTACRHISAIEKFVSEFSKSGIYPLNPALFIEEDFFCGEVYHCSECDCVSG